MPTHSQSPSRPEPQVEAVLTLAEAAAFLRTNEKALAEMATAGTIPAREIDGEWRFSRRALEDWLRFPGLSPKEYGRLHPCWLCESHFMDEFILLMEKRMTLHQKPTEGPSPKPGSKAAVLKHFGVFRDDPSLQAMVDEIYARRKGRSEEGEE